MIKLFLIQLNLSIFCFYNQYFLWFLKENYANITDWRYADIFSY